MRKSTNIRFPWSWIDYTGDGVFSKERIKGKDKRILGKRSRKKVLDEIESSFDEYEEEDVE